MRETLNQLWSQTGIKPIELEEPEIPIAGIHVWDWYWEICSGTDLSAQEIEAFMRLTGDEIHPWEVKALLMMDRCVKGFFAERAKPEEVKPHG